MKKVSFVLLSAMLLTIVSFAYAANLEEFNNAKLDKSVAVKCQAKSENKA